MKLIILMMPKGEHLGQHDFRFLKLNLPNKREIYKWIFYQKALNLC